MNLGVDLGSTYSSFSTYNKDTHNVDLCRPGQGTPEAIPSIACLDDDNAILTGYDARQHLLTTDPGARTFSAFKMLLTENNEELLRPGPLPRSFSASRSTRSSTTTASKKWKTW